VAWRLALKVSSVCPTLWKGPRGNGLRNRQPVAQAQGALLPSAT